MPFIRLEEIGDASLMEKAIPFITKVCAHRDFLLAMPTYHCARPFGSWEYFNGDDSAARHDYFTLRLRHSVSASFISFSTYWESSVYFRRSTASIQPFHVWMNVDIDLLQCPHLILDFAPEAVRP